MFIWNILLEVGFDEEVREYDSIDAVANVNIYAQVGQDLPNLPFVFFHSFKYVLAKIRRILFVFNEH